jgi:PAS domain S-box-containing protein
MKYKGFFKQFPVLQYLLRTDYSVLIAGLILAVIYFFYGPVYHQASSGVASSNFIINIIRIIASSKQGLFLLFIVILMHFLIIMKVTEQYSKYKKLKKYLNENEMKFFALFNNTSDPVLVYTLQGHKRGNYIEVNEAACRVYGYTRQEFMNMNASDLNYLDIKDIEDDVSLKYLIENKHHIFSRIHKTKIGECFPVEINAQVFELFGQTLVLAIARDVTQRNKYEARLKKSEEQYRLLAENANDIIWTTDLTLIYTYISPSVKKIKKFDPEEIIGKPISFLLSDSDTKKAWSLLEKHLPAAVNDPSFTLPPMEFRSKDKDGNFFWTEVSVSLMRDDRGNPAGFLGVSRDIEERKKMEKWLLDSEKYFRSLIELSSDAIIVINRKGIVLYESPAIEKITGRISADGTGKHFLYGIARGFHRVAKDNFHKMVNEGVKKVMFPVEMTGNDNKRYKALVTAQNMLDESAVRGIVVSFRDISETEQMNERLKRTINELERSNDSLAQFAYAASHDLKEPLRGIATSLQLLQKKIGGSLDDDSLELMNMAIKSSAKMHNMIKAVLDYSRVNPNENKKEIFNLGKPLEYAINSLAHMIEERKCLITADPLPDICGEQPHFELLFLNLLGNSIKFQNDSNPMINIGKCVVDGRDAIFIKDNGIGIEPAHFKRIFELFSRLHNDELFPGTGIGLTICKKIVELYGGRIWVESEPGKGSVFYFTLPENKGC